MTSEPATICPRCGRKVSAGEDCAHCVRSKVFWLVQRATFLLPILAAIVLAAYFGTLAFANANREMKAKLAIAWYREGERLLQASHPDQAVTAFRKAIFNDRGNRAYIRALAHALEADGRDQEALDLLLQVRDTAPEDPEINVELGRIAVRQDNVQDAVRYYHNALYGIWTGDDIDLQRTQVRRELIEFLLARHVRDQALAEILALGGHLSNTAASHLELGDLFLRAGDPARALAELREVLRGQPRNQAALQGAAQAAFEVGDYALARRFLSSVNAPDAQAAKMLEVATLVMENDPIATWLTARERDRRLLADLAQATQHLEDCLAQHAAATNAAPLRSLQDKLQSLRLSLTAAKLKSDPNLPFSALELIYEAEDAASRLCGPPQGIDEALLLIAQKSGRAEP